MTQTSLMELDMAAPSFRNMKPKKKKKTTLQHFFPSSFLVIFSMISVSSYKWKRNVFIKCLREHVSFLFHFSCFFQPCPIGRDDEKASTNDKKTKNRSDCS